MGKFLVGTRDFCMARVSFVGCFVGCTAESSLMDLWSSGGAVPAMVYGVLWGVGGLTFGLSMRYLGVALGQSIALGTCAGFGTLFLLSLPEKICFMVMV